MNLSRILPSHTHADVALSFRLVSDKETRQGSCFDSL